MESIKTRPLPRDAIAAFIDSPRGVRAFEDLQGDTTNIFAAVGNAAFLTLQNEPSLGSERVLTPQPGEIEGADGGPNGNYTLGLADTAVAPGFYGDASHLVSVTVDAKGRLTAASEFALSTTNITEGSNLFFTTARARSALSSGAGINYNSGTGVIAVTPAATYGTPTGSLSRSTFITYTAAAISSPPTQAEVQDIANALQVATRVLAALVTDLQANGNLS